MPEYKKHYTKDGIYGDLSYGGPWVSRGIIHATYVSQNMLRKVKDPKVLVIGAGNGYDMLALMQAGYDVHGIDLYVPDVPCLKEHITKGDASDMPFEDNQFTLVLCCETLEHIPMDICDKIIDECKRVAQAFYFTIATRGDGPYNTHINIRNGEDWIKSFRDKGFKIHHAALASEVMIKVDNVMQGLKYLDGVTIYGEC